ncbi:MAG: hypothetical protein HWN80_17830 [Candidatus Lokiarchaeota archaeon]|nr:hypothetical protein [Candidatus Lokiarchaeota archaeon]
MTEELLKIFDENRKTPLEDKLNQTIDSFENMFSLFLEVTDIIDNKLNSLQEQITSLETRFNRLEQDLKKNLITSIDHSPSPAPAIKKENLDNPSRAVLNELRDLFEKNKKIKD